MALIRFDCGALTRDDELLGAPTARAIAKVLPLAASAMTRVSQFCFGVTVTAPRVFRTSTKIRIHAV